MAKAKDLDLYSDKAQRRAGYLKCAVCNAFPGEPCTRPTSTGRKEVGWFHSSRLIDALDDEIL